MASGGKLAEKNIQITFDQDTSRKIRAWAAAFDFEPGHEREAARSLMMQALASAPIDGVMSAARIQAYSQTRLWMMNRFLQAVVEIREDLKRELGTGGLE